MQTLLNILPITGSQKRPPNTVSGFAIPNSQIFLNYLNIFFNAIEYDVPEMSKVLETHKLQLETKLEEYRPCPGLWSKYSWVAQSHNFFCSSYKQKLFAHRKIPARLLRLQTPPYILNLNRRRGGGVLRRAHGNRLVSPQRDVIQKFIPFSHPLWPLFLKDRLLFPRFTDKHRVEFDYTKPGGSQEYS